MRATAARESAHEGRRSGRDAGVSLVADAARAARAPASLTAHAFGATARLAGNQAVAQLARRRAGGSPLPPAAPARRLLGPDADRVRVHADDGGAFAARPGALARTDGFDITVARSAPSPETTEGGLLLAHEAAHVVQQTRPGGSLAEAQAEAEADVAAVAALEGRTGPALGAAGGPQFFEARMHQASLTNAMAAAGFTDQEQEAAYFANWCRDLSQAVVPVLNETAGLQATMTAIQLISQKKFGRSVSPAELGAYDPAEHIDNPAGQIPSDLVNRAGAVALPGRGEFAGNEQAANDLDPKNIAASYEVDDSGVPAYIDRSRMYIREQATLALAEGRTPEGLSHVGNFSHTVEDLFAHSNWVEAAVGLLIKEGKVPLEGEVAQSVDERKQQNRPPVETYAAEIADRAHGTRPILMTGTFSPGAAGHDTLISIKSEAQNLLAEANPFGKEDKGDLYWSLGLEVLRHAEAAAQENTLGTIFADHVGQIVHNLGGLIRAQTGGLVGSAREAAGGGWLGEVAAGGARLLNEGAGAATALVEEGYDEILKDAVAEAAEMLGDNIDLVELAMYVKRGLGQIPRAWNYLKDQVKRLPDTIKEIVLPELNKAEEAFKKAVKELGDAAWTKATATIIDALEGAVGQLDPAESPVSRKLEAMKEKELPELRAKIVGILREVAPGPQGEAAIAAISAADAAAVIAFAEGPELAAILTGLSAADAAALRGATANAQETATRISQIENVPEWARSGASHSQLAKDHADSPFFGAAFAVANAADTNLMKALQAAWADAGFTAAVPELAGGFTKPPEREGVIAPSATIDEQAAERERQKKFLETRELGQSVLKRGHAETLPVEALVHVADALVEVQRKRPILGPVLNKLIDLLRQAATGKVILAEIARVRAKIASEGDTQLQDLLDRHPEVIEEVKQLLEAAESFTLVKSDQCKSGESREEHTSHAGRHEEHETPEQHEEHTERAKHGTDDPRTEAHFESQLNELDKHRGAGALVTPGRERAEGTGPEADQRVAMAATAEEQLLTQIDQIFSHPYDTAWWRPVLEPWARDHAAILAQAILDRNSGDVHSHAH